MNLWHRFLGWFDKDTDTLKLDTVIAHLTAEVYYKELALQAGINLIANALSMAEFRTYEKGKEVFESNHYLLNVEPNPNKNASKFWRDVVSRLVYENECLIIQQDGYFYCADSFITKPYAFKDYVFESVVVDGLELKEPKFQGEVLHLELHNTKMKTIIDGLYDSYGKLITASQKYYKQNNAKRGTLEVPTQLTKTPEGQAHVSELLGVHFKRFFDAESSAIVPLSRGEKYTEIENKSVKGGTEGRDIRAFVDDVFDMVAIALNIPPTLLKGEVADTDKAVNDFLAFCVNPLGELLDDEINRKYYGKKHYLERTYCKLDTRRIKVTGLKDVANALDVLLRAGAYTIDDCLIEMGLEPIGGDLGGQRWITKNYEPIEHSLKGGE